jgi:hypothetical protein
MSRPQKVHKPIKAGFNTILGAIALGGGTAKRAATRQQARASIVRASIPKPTPKKP